MEPNVQNMEANSPLVTIGIPVYNVEPYIEKCLLSVLNQTYQNLEILVVDDLGTDKSMQIVENIQKNHYRGSCIKIYIQTHNSGSGEARNSVIRQAKGHYIYFLDSDDYIEPNTIELMLKEAEEHHTDAVIASLRKVIWNTDQEQATLQYSSYMLIQGEDEFAKYVCQDLRWHIAITACNILFTTSFLRNKNLFFLASKDEDALFLSDYYSEIENAVIMPDVFYNYVIRPGSKMGNNLRSQIPVREIRDRFVTDAIMTERCARLKNRSFFDVHCARVIKHKFRAVCVALKHRRRFTEYLSGSEIRHELRHPATLQQILKFKRYKLFHLCFYVLGKLPSPLFIAASYGIGKALKWI
jgi:glycosyltransferase involved in cell wall biosynthesis